MVSWLQWGLILRAYMQQLVSCGANVNRPNYAKYRHFGIV